MDRDGNCALDGTGDKPTCEFDVTVHNGPRKSVNCDVGQVFAYYLMGVADSEGNAARAVSEDPSIIDEELGCLKQFNGTVFPGDPPQGWAKLLDAVHTSSVQYGNHVNGNTSQVVQAGTGVTLYGRTFYTYERT